MNAKNGRPKRRGAGSLARSVVAKVTKHGVSRDLVGKIENIKIVSVGTERNTRGCLKRFIQWLRVEQHKDWSALNESDVNAYLQMKAEKVKQATLDGDRLALQRVVTFEIPFVVSKTPTLIVPRAYLAIHIAALCKFADDELSLSIAIAADAGLRAKELLTLAPTDVLKEDRRLWHAARFTGRTEPFEIFCVGGKGGLDRYVAISKNLANEIHQRRRDSPREFTDREVKGEQYFNLLGGQLLSHYFSQHSLSLLGFSTGFHGLRHHFAQRRMFELQATGLTWDEALNVLDNELGHFSLTNTRKYLR